ncbi:uncharacterized protein DS421_16g549280 [Arachis hypogaea]|nr:uncharacterized protein DS421_16g549280 [Arachis hypogaea]
MLAFINTFGILVSEVEHFVEGIYDLMPVKLRRVMFQGLWGLSLYYLDRFEEGAEQFRLDVAQNPNDTEESICCFLCEAQLYGVDEARK